ncbi:MAG TPA: hypothetical protein VJT81_04555 [Burkholderiales bacterium]|nr:hypothetical protein [Burkholderiales bacterium]
MENDVEQSVLGQPYQPSMSQIAIDRMLDSGASAGWQHEYQILDLPAVNGVAAQTNGHVHRTGPTWRKVSSERSIRVQPRLAVSSNALRHPKDLDAQDLSLSAAIEQRIAGDASRAWWLALYADDRFGDMRFYPGLYVQMVSRNDHELRLGFPDSSWRWRLSERLQSELIVAPDGGKWRVRDEELAQHSDVQLRAWELVWIARWQPVDALAFDVRIGRRFKTDLRYLLQDGSSANVDVPDASFFGFSITGRF